MARVVQLAGRREAYWRSILARWKRSGLSVRTFCRTEGLNQGTFYWWRREAYSNGCLAVRRNVWWSSCRSDGHGRRQPM